MAPKKRRSDGSPDVTVYDIGNSTSSFGEKAEKFLNIRIYETDSFDNIINHDVSISDTITYDESDINCELKDLF